VTVFDVAVFLLGPELAVFVAEFVVELEPLVSFGPPELGFWVALFPVVKVLRHMGQEACFKHGIR